MTDSPSLIDRREYKLLIGNEMAERVRRAIAPFCRLDPFAATHPLRSYGVDTLYLDTDDLALFWANDHEQVDRIKMRVRRYADNPDSPLFFEVKRRINDVISKSRGRVSPEHWVELLQNPKAEVPASSNPRDRAAIERFMTLARTLRVKPFTLVRYQREPWVSTIDDYARVTFDTHIRAHAVDSYTFRPQANGWRAIDDAVSARELASMVVLELKFTSSVPLWLVNICRNLGLVRGAFSKYGNSIRAFYQPVSPRVPRTAGGWR
ncbi:MAG TPA: polyphosphate polymerase domain-containing protein [Nannocystaceae bacterium]|nr:polyphosphate polymerase domain-containing protein [Nannocystaceae bacterium]